MTANERNEALRVVEHERQISIGPTPSGSVVDFPVKKRRRGRPRKLDVRKQPELQTPSTADFDHTCMAIVGISKGGFAAAQKELLRTANKDERLPGYARQVLMHQVYGMNRKKGFNWHGEQFIAQETGLAPRSVRAGREILGLCGYTLRRAVIRKGSHSSKHWETTLPALVDAALTVARSREAKATKVHQAEHRLRRSGTTIPKERHNKIGEGAAQLCPLILEEESSKKSTAPSADIQKEAFRGSEVEVDDAQRAKLAGLMQQFTEQLKSSGQPRFNKALPLENRITTWRNRRPPPEDRNDSDLYHRMMRAARNAAGDVLDLERLKAEFCKWMTGKPPPEDAQAAWVGWLESTAARRATRRTIA